MAGKQNKMLLRRLPGPRKRVGERVHTYAHARTKTISRPKYIYIANSLESQLRSLRSLRWIKYLIGEKITKTVSYHLNLHSVWPPVHPPPLPSPCHSKLNLIIWRAYISYFTWRCSHLLVKKTFSNVRCCFLCHNEYCLVVVTFCINER